LIKQLEESENVNTEQNATQEISQQQQEGNQPGGIVQHQGTEGGQQEAGQPAGSERQATQPEANSSNSNQRSEGQQQEEIAAHESLFAEANSTRSAIKQDKIFDQFNENADKARHIYNNYDDILTRLQAANDNNELKFETDCL
ncbi:MAG TPA: hypothetical protein VFS31_12185, partial [Chitinophagaceae bacterium]|nr:hypothetical protein [Chitinophagaceae bacterium]